MRQHRSVRRLHKEKLYDLYSSPNITWVIKSRSRKWAGHVACTGDSGGAYRVLVGRPEGKRPLGRCTPPWKDSIKTVLQEVGWEGNELD